MKRYTMLIICGILLAGCATQPGQKTTIGAMGGAAAGGLLAATFGGNATGIAAGTLLGGLLGGAVGSRLDAADRQAMTTTTLHAVQYQPSGTTSTWHNGRTGHYGSVTPGPPYQTAGRECREYQASIVIGGRTEEGFGTACRTSTGAWEIQ
jgi:surface antigen